MSPVSMNETFSSSLRVVAENLLDSDRPYMPAGYHSSNLLSPCLVALKVAVLDITLNVTKKSGPIVESITVEMLGLQCRARQWDAEVHKLDG